ncbi:MAG: hypothetical protein ETSY2_46440 [Candidatus Entotheonella gemina]|uniref:Uncharacterized protein n=1 Tax=Candidatus Entotheonella gemina TaxID=1429439 RepID=W4LGF3_9BACT|nr:MAG: hypothetical protein ETSY2_46440 [Candidatus Entotheonella gemina]
MTVQTIHIQLPDEMYQRFRQVAHATNQPLEEVVFQTIRGNLPPSLDDLDPKSHSIVADLQQLSDDRLWTIAKEELSPEQWRRHQELLQKAYDDDLTAAEMQELETLRETTDRLITRRSYALALLKWHGHTIPTDL